jgi:hypothetical protein
METLKFSLFENIKQPSTKTCTELQVVKWLKDPRIKERIDPIRKLYEDGKNKEADRLKEQLPAITPSGTFLGSHSDDKLDIPTNIVCLDFDDLPKDKVEELREKAALIPYTFMCFISPSGLGIKIWIKINCGVNYHKEAYVQVAKYYEEVFGVSVDKKACNIGRLMFLSYDPHVYYYPDSDVFAVVTPISGEAKVVSIQNRDETYYTDLYNKAYAFTSKKERYEPQNKNNFIFLLACNCNRMGLPKEELFIRLHWCDKDPSEIKSTVNSAYKKVELFNTW